MEDFYQITRAAELEALPLFRKLIEEACKQRPGIHQETIYDLQLAVDEACTNIIEHGYAGMNPGSIILTLEFQLGQVQVHLTDFGHPFEPSQAPLPDIEASLDERLPGGFGLFFIYQTMDQVLYETSEDGNRLTFVKAL